MAKVLCFDIDGILTKDADTDHQDLSGVYATRILNTEVKELISKAVASGWTTTLFTGRKEGSRRLTENWLYAHGVEYHYLFMDKPYFTYMIDDRSRSVEEIKDLIKNEER